MWLEFLKILKGVAELFSFFFDVKGKPKLSVLITLALVISFAATIFFWKKSFEIIKETPPSTEPSLAEQSSTVDTPGMEPVHSFTGEVDISGEVTEQGEEITYSYTPIYSDAFFLEFCAESEEMSVDFAVLHENKTVENRPNISAEKFIYVYMEKGEMYDIKISQHTGVGMYSVKVTSWNDSGRPVTLVPQNNQTVGYFYYTGQERTFRCESNMSGTYSVEFYDIDPGMIFDVEIKFSSGQNQVVVPVEAPHGSVKFDMIAGEEYYVHVKQKQNYGEYAVRLNAE